MKKLLMGLKTLGKVITKNTPDNETSSKPPTPPIVDPEFTENELAFILTKLRSANYTGAEFEMFYSVWVKLLNIKPKK